MPTVYLRPKASADDAFENAGTVTLTDIAPDTNAATKWFGVRFPSVPIPKGSTINSAILSVLPSNSSNDEPKHTFYGEAADDAAQFAATSNNISGRTRTSASVLWDNANLGADGSTFFSPPDLKTIVQEIVNRSGWVSGNALSLLWNGNADTTRDLAIITFDSGPNKEVLTVDFTPPAGTAISLQVGASADDAGESAIGVVSITESPSIVADATNKWLGMRFQNVTIPQGATITWARLWVQPSSQINDEPSATFYGHAADNSGAFTTGSNDISGRSRTSASVAWSDTDCGAGNSTTGKIDWFGPPDISTIIQEIVNRSGWASGNSLSIVCQGSADAARDLSIITYDGTPSAAAKLEIVWVASGGGNSVGSGRLVPDSQFIIGRMVG
jgi:type IV pilus assembly protein PilY1